MAATLVSMAQRAAIRNIDAVLDIGHMPYQLARPILKEITNPNQLQAIEDASPHIAEHDAELWKVFIKRDVSKWEEKWITPKNPRSWGKVYRKLMRQEKRDIEKAEEELKANMAALAQKKKENSVPFLPGVFAEPIRQKAFVDGIQNRNVGRWGKSTLPKVTPGSKNAWSGKQAPVIRANRVAPSEMARLRNQDISPQFLPHTQTTSSPQYRNVPAIVPPQRPIAPPTRVPNQATPATMSPIQNKSAPVTVSTANNTTAPASTLYQGLNASPGVVDRFALTPAKSQPRKKVSKVFNDKPATTRLDRTLEARERAIDAALKREEIREEQSKRVQAARSSASRSPSQTPPAVQSGGSTPTRKMSQPSVSPIVQPARSASPVKNVLSTSKPSEPNSSPKATTPGLVGETAPAVASPVALAKTPSPSPAPPVFRKRPGTSASIFMPAKKRRVV